MAPHSSTLAWKIPWTKEPGGLQSRGTQRVGHDWNDWAHTQHRQNHSVQRDPGVPGYGEGSEGVRHVSLFPRPSQPFPPSLLGFIPHINAPLAFQLLAGVTQWHTNRRMREERRLRMENLFTWFPLCRIAAPSLTLDQRSCRSVCLQTLVLPPLASSDTEHSSSHCPQPHRTCTVPRDFLTSCQHLCKQSS